jgi:heme oxygenase
MERAEAIAHDLSALGLEVFDEPHPAAVSWLGEIRRVAEREPMIWLGVVYLFEGSRMGSMLLVRSLSRALGVAANVGMGLDYHLQGANESYAHWQRLKERLDGLPLVESDRMAACQGAKATFRMLHDVYSTPAELQLSTELT